MLTRFLALAPAMLACFFVTLTPQAYSQPDPSLVEGLKFRFIGPWRGGRVTTVTGVPENPHLYYMGAAGGGVWKTENAGHSWSNISDGQIPVGTIGAIAVAPSDSNVIYVGTGEAPIRGVTTAQGEGLWKSTDAGRTFAFKGLPDAGQIAKIEVHPTDPDTAWVAVQGQIWAPNPERGVYKTTDGGASWKQVLKVNDDTGATDISLDPTNPRILYAAMWHHGRKPWYIKSGGDGGGIYKSVDGGDTWDKLGGGLPKLVGKIGLDVSASQPSRIYAIIESEPEQGGLWRSDNYGKTWSLINPHRVLHTRAWYYIHLTADPNDPDTVWVLNVPLMKSIDGGKTFTKISTPHSDHQDHWINPDNSNIMINGNDGGATVTLDGGKTWSTLNNQPTSQFYRLITDNQTPWRLYAGQQDNSTMSIAAWAWDGSIGPDDYYAVGGGESAHIAFDPDDPQMIYATTINGTLTEYNSKTKKSRYIVPYPERVFGEDAKNLKYRSNWNSPVITSPHDRSVIYYGTQYLLKSTDRGMTWTQASPDLTRNNPDHLGRNGGPLTPENVGAEFYHTIFYIVESEKEQGTIWVGADDGLLHITRDGGGDWKDISPSHRGEAMINAIELSPHQEGTAYVAVTGYKLNDFKPYIYKPTNYGKRWKRIDKGLPKEAFVRVVREDPLVKDLLYAGTEKGLFVSWNAGKDWQETDLNLPTVPITDIRVRDDALALSTQGRGFWVLDDLFVLRQAANKNSDSSLVLYETKDWSMGRPGSRGRNFEGSNPSPSLPIYYYLKESVDQDTPLTIDILDANGTVVRHYSTVESDHDRCLVAGMDPRFPFKLKYPSKKAGLQKWSWNLRANDISCVDGHTMFTGYRGPAIGPGNYKVRVTAGDHVATSETTVLPDPRVEASADETRAWVETQREIALLLEEVMSSLQGAKEARTEIRTLLERQDDKELKDLADKAIAAIDAWEMEITELRHETFEDEDAWVMKIDGQLRHLMDAVTGSGAPVTEGAMERYKDLSAEWSSLKTSLRSIEQDMIAPINRWAKASDVPQIPNAK